MLLAVLAGLVGLATVVVALQRDHPLDPDPVAPDWDVLPDPTDLARVSFPISLTGYDPATVELTFDALAAAYADLLAVADGRTIERARRRAALRLGVEADASGGAAALPDPPAPYPQSGPSEALRAEAALAALADEAGREEGEVT